MIFDFLVHSSFSFLCCTSYIVLLLYFISEKIYSTRCRKLQKLKEWMDKNVVHFVFYFLKDNRRDLCNTLLSNDYIEITLKFGINEGRFDKIC